MSRRTIPRPRPRLPPVTITLRMTRQLPGGGHLERGNETDRRWNLVGRQPVVADLKDLAPEVHDPAARTARIGLCLQDDVCGDERTGDGTSRGPHHRHADRRMSVDRRFDFFRIDLQSADVDDAVPSTEEVVPVAAAFHHVARVDEAFIIGEGGTLLAEIADGITRGTDTQRAVVDFELNVAGRADHARRKPLEAIV